MTPRAPGEAKLDKWLMWCSRCKRGQRTAFAKQPTEMQQRCFVCRKCEDELKGDRS